MTLAPLPRRARARRNATLLAGCALALVLAAAPQRAAAQTHDGAFQGTATVPAGAATVFKSPNYTEVTVTAPQTVINWSPTSTATSGTIDFQPEGTTAEFVSFNLTDYTVLNRILPGGTATIGLNGTITSSVYDGGEGQMPGGNVWFYTPNGFVVGPRAVINVGGLIMTTNDIVFGSANTGGDTLTSASGAILFRGGLNPASSITISPGGQISSGSYLAMVSPRIVQGGRVSAERSIAYVAAEEVDLTIDAGNFDISIGRGTSDANGIDHTGTSTGSASTGFDDQKRISFVAVPKNTALTMLLAGDIGYSAASSVFDDGSAIVLSAGADGSADGNIAIGTTYFANAVEANATGDLTVAPSAPGPFSEGISTTTFASFADLSGGKSATLRSVAGTAIVAEQGLTVSSTSAAGGGAVVIEALGSSSFASPGAIRVAGNLNVSADHTGGNSADETTGLDGRAGSVSLRADGGTIAANSISASASGYGGVGSIAGGLGQGGTVDLRAGFGGSIESGFTTLYAVGHGGQSVDRNAQESTGGQGGVGRGGSIAVADSSGDSQTDPTGGSLVLSSLFADASAVGGNSASFGAGLGGDAFGGAVRLTFDRQDQSLFSLYATARASDGDSAFDPVGGTIDMVVGGGVSVSLDQLIFDTSALASVNGPAGAFGLGGSIGLTVQGGAALDVIGGTYLTSRASTTSFFGTPDRSPDVTGGNVRMTVDNARFTTRDLFVDVSASNVGATNSAGFARGGTALIESVNGGTIATVPSDGFGGTFSVDAQASGTNGAFASNLTGGSITLSARSGGSIEAGSQTLELYAGAFGRIDGGNEEQSGNTAGNGANAQGGTIAIDALGGAMLSSILADVTGIGGLADANGSSGTGGTIAVRVLAGELNGTLLAQAYGTGGDSLVSGNAGDGRGGRLTFASDADADFQAFGLTFNGYGTGGSAVAGASGDGHGGSAQADILGGSHAWSDAIFDASARGGSSLGAGSVAGSAYGSPAGLVFHLGNGASLSAPFLSLNARAIAGANGAGNEAVGGTALVTVDGGAGLSVGGLGIDASASLAFEERSANDINTTPTARGGSAAVVADGGTISTSRLDVLASAQTGGAMIDAGSATGGTATVGAANGGAIEILASSEGGGVLIEALGLGGEGPSAANAAGGTATLYTAGGRFESPFALVVRADAAAGEFAGLYNRAGLAANGFAAAGGTASVEMRAGTGAGSISVPSVVVSASGLADTVSAVHGAGGAGVGGTARIAVTQGTFDTGEIEVTAEGRGGLADERADGGAAFASGNGTGGTSELRLTGGTIATTSLSISAIGSGADGIGGTSGATPSLAGVGTGGAARLVASGGTLANSGSLSLDATGFGGSGAFNPNPGPGGNGATGIGGTASFSAPAGSTATLSIAGPIVLNAIGSGGSAGLSGGGASGNGGAGTGGIASLAMADIAFDFANVSINAAGQGGFGPNGNGTGGIAQFALVDTLASASSPRRIGQLTLQSSGSGSGATTGGATEFTAQAGNAGSGLTITGDLVALADGTVGPAGNGFTGLISGAPVTVGGRVLIVTPRDATLTIGAGGTLQSSGDFDAEIGRAFTASGPIATAANASIIAPLGITMTDLAAGGTTLLQAINGPVTISRDLRSGGLVTVLGRSVNLVSLGALAFADADAAGGDLAIQTAGDLDLATVDATGAVTLTSTGGSIHNTGAVNGVGIAYTAAGDVRSDEPLASGGALSVNAGGAFSAPGTVSAVGNVSLSADLGMALAGVVSGGTTLLQADAGTVTVDSLTSPGAVTARARGLTIASPGSLAFTEARATAGNLTLTAAGNLALAQGGASGAVALTSSGGSVSGTGPITAGGDLAITGHTGIALGTATSGGTTALTSANGAVGVTNLNSVGAVTARGRAVTIGSSGALSFADLDATAGNIAVETAGNLAVTTVDATGGSVTLRSTGGALQAGGAINGNGITLGSFADLQLASLATAGAIDLSSAAGAVTATGPIAAGGNLGVNGQTGITLGTATSGGTTSLISANGAVAVSNLNSPGAVTARGRAVTIGSGGALSFADLDATSGNIVVQTAGNLSLTTVDAAGSITLRSTGGTLEASGAINGNGITLGSQADLKLASLASAGAIDLTSTGGSISATGAVAAGGNLAANGHTGVALGTASSGGTTALASANGGVTATNLSSAGVVTARGRSVTLGSSGALAFADLDATAGDIAVQTAGNLSVASAVATGSVTLRSTGGALQASGAINGNGITLASQANLQVAGLTTSGAISLASTAGSVSSSGPVAAGGTLTVAGDRGIALGSATSGGTTALAAPNGAITVSSLSSPGALTATGRSVEIASGGALTVADARATAGDLRLAATGNLTLAQASASGAASLSSSDGDVTAVGPVAAGGALSVAGATGVTLGSATSGGTTALTSSNGAIQVGNLTSTGAVTAAGRAVDLRSTGSLTIASAQASAGALNLQTSGGLTIGTATATGTANLAAGGDLRTTGAVQAAGMTVSGANVRADGLLRSSAGLSMSAQQLLTINALAAGTTVNAAAGDIAIGSTGRLGQRGLTATLTITNQNASLPMNFGGAAQPGEFSIDKAEAARLFADQQIALVARSGSTTPGDIRIGELAMAYGAVTSGANIGAGGTLKVDAPGRIEVNGAVALTTVSSSDRFSIDPTRIDVIAGSGSIAMRSAAGALQGILDMQASTIAVADKPTIAAIAGSTDFGAISRLLDQPVAGGQSQASLQAGTINLQVADALYIQNTGATSAFADRRGFSANELVIFSTAANPRIAINGVIITPQGTLTGLKTAEAVTINHQVASAIARGATITINGCAVGINCDVASYTYGGRSEDDLERPLSIVGGSQGPTGELIQVEPNQPLITPPLVDEPITGVGNDDLWQPKCGPEREDGACPATEAPE